MSTSPRRRAARLLAILLTSVVLAAPLSSPAQADPPSPVRDGNLVLDGHGYGHGRGMSQWGAYGAATSGLGWASILDFYYPGTTRSQIGNTPIRVHLSVDTGADVRVDAAAGLTLVSGSASAVLPTGTAYSSWRLVRAGGALQLQRLPAGGAWVVHASPVALGPTAGFRTPADATRLVLPSGNRMVLRGTVTAVPEGSSVLRTVAVLPIDSYLRGVVPAEMSPSWHEQALRAQSVAARTYAARQRAGSSGRGYDTCDTTSCQTFAGTATYSSSGQLLRTAEHPRTDAAVAATTGVALTHPSVGLAFTEFSAANGGWTVAGSAGHPYQVSKSDPYDGVVPSQAHAWTTTVAATAVSAAFPAVGSLRSVQVRTRTGQGDLGGRVLSMSLVGSRGTVEVTGAQFAAALRLRSSWFAVRGTGAGFSRDLDGDARADVLAVDAAGSAQLYPGAAGTGFGRRTVAATDVGATTLRSHAGDWDLDGHPDLVTTTSDGTLRLHRGSGAGRYAAPVAIGRGWGSVRELAGPGDWDGDGRADLLAVMADGTLQRYGADGAGGFAARVQVGRGWGAMRSLTAVGDLTGDGNGDVVAVRRDTSALVVYPGDGAGGFRAGIVLGRGWDAVDVLLGPGDWDEDGRADLLARRTDGTLVLYRGDGAGGFSAALQVGHGWGGLALVP